MIKLLDRPCVYRGGKLVKAAAADKAAASRTMAYKILSAHNVSGNDGKLKIKFDEITSHDITYVGIIQTAKASGLKEFPLPYTMTNCHNSLCAVGGTINEDDHVFGLSAAKKYGGAYVPPHIAVIHQYMREKRAFGGAMILGSDSHTRYGAIGTMAVGEGGPELVKQLLGKTYDIDMPEIVAVYLKGRLKRGVGPHDVALALVKAVFKNGFVKNKVMEFVGPGIKTLSMDFRNGIDVMTTETTCLSSIWETDGRVEEYLACHGRKEAFKELHPEEGAYYDAGITVDLSEVEPMIALPFHPSNAYTIREFKENAYEILKKVEEEGGRLLGGKGEFRMTDKIKDGKVYVDQGVIAGCAGGMYENVAAAAEILKGSSLTDGEFALNIYPSSQPVYKGLVDNGYISRLIENGAVIKTAFCGPCFGAGDVPANNGLSVRHTTRNFESREGSKPSGGQLAAVALMDARSIAATAKNGGVLTAATEIDYTDPVTTTDELIPSGETSSYRSNPLKLAEFALSRKDPQYVGRAKAIQAEDMPDVAGADRENTTYGSVVCAVKPGDGSAREQAASCQRVLGGAANIAVSYATKRYRSNVINWGMLPFLAEKNDFAVGELIFVPDVRKKLLRGDTEFPAKVYGGNPRDVLLKIDPLTADEKEIVAKGCLINFYAK